MILYFANNIHQYNHNYLSRLFGKGDLLEEKDKKSKTHLKLNLKPTFNLKFWQIDHN